MGSCCSRIENNKNDSSFYYNVTGSREDKDFAIIPDDAVLDKLALMKYYPAKIKINDVQRANVCRDTPNNVALLLLAKMLCLDLRARDGSFERELELFASKKLHPQDVLLALCYCCSPMLKQNVVSKLFTCNIAIPVILGNNAFVRPLYFIDVTEKCIEEKLESRYLSNQNVCFVSFLRLGPIQVSKSEIINELINGTNRHSTFFCKNSPNGSLSRFSSSGSVELSYLPRVAIESRSDAITLALNLRGDGRHHFTTVKKILAISNTVVIFLDMKVHEFNISSIFRQFQNCKCPVILAVIESTNTASCDRYKLKEIPPDLKLKIMYLAENLYDNVWKVQRSIREELKGQMTEKNNICALSSGDELFCGSLVHNMYKSISLENRILPNDIFIKELYKAEWEFEELEDWYELFSYLRVKLNWRLLLLENYEKQETKHSGLFWIEDRLLKCLEQPCLSFSNKSKIFSKLHNVLLSGHFLQVMPDISRSKSIALTWHVLESLKGEQEIGSNATLLVVSIIGLVSTGKSTLLNSMFGVEFPVNFESCTKCVYAHMIPTTNKKFKYILILDTEGLTESKNPANNYLAKMIMDLSDFIIVNLKGENTSEKSRILQTLVHICVDLKQQNNNQMLPKTCIFAYQNMPKITTQNVFVPGKTQLSKTLNNLSKNSKCHQDCDFHDMIGFDLDKHVFYFPDFWCGSASTSTVNVHYIECAEKLKKTIIGEAYNKPNSLSTLSTICNRLKKYREKETHV